MGACIREKQVRNQRCFVAQGRHDATRLRQAGKLQQQHGLANFRSSQGHGCERLASRSLSWSRDLIVTTLGAYREIRCQ
jgi:hypothetical protein